MTGAIFTPHTAVVAPPDGGTAGPDAREVAAGPADTLFDMEPTAVAVTEPVEKLSADRRRTIRQKTDVARGIHPLTRRRVHDDPERTCGNCSWRQLLDYHRRAYPKCMIPGGMSAENYERYGGPHVSHSAATDVRAWWPGCTDHEWGDPKLSPDAARWVPETATP